MAAVGTLRKRHRLLLRDASKVHYRVFRLAPAIYPGDGRLSRVYTKNYSTWQEEFHFLGLIAILVRYANNELSIFLSLAWCFVVCHTRSNVYAI